MGAISFEPSVLKTLLFLILLGNSVWADEKLCQNSLPLFHLAALNKIGLENIESQIAGQKVKWVQAENSRTNSAVQPTVIVASMVTSAPLGPIEDFFTTYQIYTIFNRMARQSLDTVDQSRKSAEALVQSEILKEWDSSSESLKGFVNQSWFADSFTRLSQKQHSKIAEVFNSLRKKIGEVFKTKIGEPWFDWYAKQALIAFDKTELEMQALLYKKEQDLLREGLSQNEFYKTEHGKFTFKEASVNTLAACEEISSSQASARKEYGLTPLLTFGPAKIPGTCSLQMSPSNWAEKLNGIYRSSCRDDGSIANDYNNDRDFDQHSLAGK